MSDERPNGVRAWDTTNRDGGALTVVGGQVVHRLEALA